MVLYAACVLLLCRGPSGLVVRASDYYSEGLRFKSQLVLELFPWINFSLSLSTSLSQTEFTDSLSNKQPALQ